MIKKNQYNELGSQILELVGGKSNVSNFNHCVTRLRFDLKDKSLIDENAIRSLKGVMGCQFSSGQFQIIIGPEVKKVFNVILPLINGNIDVDAEEKVKERLTIKTIGSKIITNFTSCVTPALPIIICAGMLKMILAILGPTVLNLIKADTGLYTILFIAGDAGFYFLPIYLGYTTAKHFKTNIFTGMLMGAILVHPTLIDIATKQINLNYIGIPVTAVNYSTSVLPVVLIVWVMSYVRKIHEKIIPQVLQPILVDALTVIAMLPLALCILGPLGFILSKYINELFLGFYNVLGPIGIGIIAALYLILIMTGMHHAVNFAAIVTLTTTGYDRVIFVGATACISAVLGANLGFILKAKKAENKSLGITATTLQAVAGIVEPTLFGIYLPFRRVFLAQSIGAFCGGTVMGFLGVKMFALTGTNVLILAGYLGNGMNNFIYACIGVGIALIVSFVVTLVVGFEEK